MPNPDLSGLDLAALTAARGEHWITLLVTGPHGLRERATVSLRHPGVRLLDESHVPYLRAQLAAIARVRQVHRLDYHRGHWFDALACDWSDSVDRFNDQEFHSHPTQEVPCAAAPSS